jgi:hypothetical protein
MGNMSETVETNEAVFDLQVKEFNLGTLPVPEPPKLYDLTLRFTATLDELTALRAYVDEHGLKYEKIA